MSLRIIAGVLKGRIIPSPVSQGTRPTTDMWRSSMFSALEERLDLENIDVLDLFAGTGALGLECLSRGAGRAVFVEQDHPTAAQLQETIENLAMTPQSTVIEDDVARYLKSANDRFDLILADPPYALRVANKMRDAIVRQQLLRPGGWLLIEHGSTEFLLPDAQWTVAWHKERSGTTATLQQWLPSAP